MCKKKTISTNGFFGSCRGGRWGVGEGENERVGDGGKKRRGGGSNFSSLLLVCAILCEVCSLCFLLHGCSRLFRDESYFSGTELTTMHLAVVDVVVVDIIAVIPIIISCFYKGLDGKERSY